MNEIYVTGHKNPDTDSIVAAMAYANLRNALGDLEYKAVRIGSINDETRNMLDRFGFEAPMFVKNMKTQVRDLEFDRPPQLNRSVSIDFAWRTMRDGEIAAMPITNDDGTLYGMISAGDVASYDMQTINCNYVENLPIFNLLSVLEAQLVNAYHYNMDEISGNVHIALPLSYEDPALLDPDSIIICGNQPEAIDTALKTGVNCIIICQTDVDKTLADAETSCIISTPMDARRVARLLFQAQPIQRICNREDIVSFHLGDYLEDAKEIMLKSRHRSYPVLDENDRVVGTVSRFHLLRPRRKRVVLVDHNEAAQSVNGLEQVEIMEIIDHHRLADIQTRQPIQMRNEPVGSTNTIITSMYQENGIMPSPQMAGLMAAAILSDTVMFKSPTCTKKDIAMAERLARIARISLEDLGKELFSVSSAEDKSAEALFFTDYKQFNISDQNIGVSQVTCADASQFLSRKDEFFEVMEKLQRDKDFDIVLLMVTDVLNDGSHLYYVGNDEVIQQAFSLTPKDRHIFLKGVMSRKKQIIPMLTALWG